MVQMMKEHFTTHAARLIYLQKSDYVDAMVRTGIISEKNAEFELARILERSFVQYGITVPDEMRAIL